jgi:hypothetical protein
VDAENQIVTLVDETGVERGFRLHDAFDLEDQHYYLVEAVDDPAEVMLLRETDEGLETVEAEEFDRVIGMLEAE